jgi:hypothetical protein
MADQYLLCRAQDGSLLNVARILGSGIELQGCVMTLEKFQELQGKMTPAGRNFKCVDYL